MASDTPHPQVAKQPSSWFSSLWPRRHELLIAGRYLFRRAPSRSLITISLLLLAATVGVELLYILVPGWQTPQMAVAALLLPLVTVVSGLLNILSVFSTVAVLGVLLGVAALTVVMAARGYPGTPEKGGEIAGIEAAERLGEFAGDRAGTENDEMPGEGGQVEDVLVGEDADFGETGDVGE